MNNFGFGGNCCWIIIVILLLICCCGCGANSNNGCGCGNSCGCNDCGNNCVFLWLSLGESLVITLFQFFKRDMCIYFG